MKSKYAHRSLIFFSLCLTFFVGLLCGVNYGYNKAEIKYLNNELEIAKFKELLNANM